MPIALKVGQPLTTALRGFDPFIWMNPDEGDTLPMAVAILRSMTVRAKHSMRPLFVPV